MREIFISNIKINKVRHLEDFQIELSDEGKRHLILTGKNGSGKTSLLDSMATFLDTVTISRRLNNRLHSLEVYNDNLERAVQKDDSLRIREAETGISRYKGEIDNLTAGVMLQMNCPLDYVNLDFKEGHFVVAYYRADRVFKAQVPKHVEKVELKKGYTIGDEPRNDFIKYLLDLKMTQALAVANGKPDKADRINRWFNSFDDLLRKIFEDNSVRLDFDEDTFKFQIIMDGREPFGFNTLSSGYAAVLDIVVDLIIRMEKQTDKVFDFSIPGIVLIDEIETHLHLDLQKKILGLLTTIFPNIQFIVSTHSPFIINSLENATIYDLEKRLLVKGGLSDIPYEQLPEICRKKKA